jgi:putative FmdB family regulatory protein
MPLYEYHCEGCGHRFEKIQKFSDPLIDECPKCGEKKVHKLVSSPAIQFKGTGWYITDYAKKGSGDSGEKKNGEPTSGEPKSSDANSAETKSSDSKTSESKASESKTSDSKSSDSKSSDSKSSTTKPATTTHS